MATRIVDSLGVAFLTLVLGPGPAWAGPGPLYMPDPVPVVGNMSVERVKDEVHAALLDTNWQVKHLGSGRMEAKQIETGKGDKLYVAVIDVHYDTKSVRIAYKESKGLEFNKEKNEIDSRYTRWVRKLEKELRKRLEGN